MKTGKDLELLRAQCLNKAEFPPEILSWIAEENLWNLWVPEAYGGLGLALGEGLERLRTLARADGSLGWTISLCSGANYFIGNLRPEVARDLFLKPHRPVCFGGSGAASGTAEKQGEHYRISGRWHYATGAPYLSHFTLNAKLLENGKERLDPEGQPEIRSFLVPREEVAVIKNWNSMGLKATASHSFELRDSLVHGKYGFHYNKYFLDYPIFKVPFSLFADLTLWVNYIGMAEHYLELAAAILPREKPESLAALLSESIRQLQGISRAVEAACRTAPDFTPAYLSGIHSEAAASVVRISQLIIQLHPLLGVRASREEEPLNQVFRDYFTATQHRNFVPG